MLCQEDNLMSLIFSGSVNMIEEEVGYSHWLSEMDEKWTGHYHDLDEKHAVPPYYLNLGQHSCPDPLLCSCGYELLPRGRYSSLDKAERVVRERRDSHFSEVFGSCYPSKHSSHFPLHCTVARVVNPCLTEDSKTENSKTEISECVNHVVDAIKETEGKKGDIFKADTVQRISWTVQDFVRVCQEPSYALPGSDRACRSLKHKIACALHKRGVFRMTPVQAQEQNLGFQF
jgi:hypothetical protein